MFQFSETQCIQVFEYIFQYSKIVSIVSSKARREIARHL